MFSTRNKARFSRDKFVAAVHVRTLQWIGKSPIYDPLEDVNDYHNYMFHSSSKTLFWTQLWGPLRQGYKCKECGLAAHKMCKDVINLRCRPKSLTSNLFSGKTFQIVHNNVLCIKRNVARIYMFLFLSSFANRCIPK